MKALVTVGVLVAMLVAVVGGAAVLVQQVVGKNLTTIPVSEAFPDEKGRPAPVGGAQNILLLGSDSRVESDARDLLAKGAQRSDVMMLVHVPADGSHVSIMSIMRDLWLPVPGHGEAKVNAALAWGGTALSIQTVETFLGARIDHVAIIDFEGLSDMTTALGGVPVDNRAPFTTTNPELGGPFFFPGGPVSLEGEKALAFVRERKAFATGDYQRVANQQALLRGILDRAISRDVLADPQALTAFASETSKNLTVDAGFTLPRIASLAYSLRGLDSSGFSFFTVPTGGTGTSPDGQSIVTVDPEATERLRQALRTDTVRDFERSLVRAK
ncbi:Putative transcriptional regulator YvhJ [Frondihabitans sp. 762G35]|nr:Putative transcriptional regulator YvhJ [Frondihabitans sp. 762G35]